MPRDLFIADAGVRDEKERSLVTSPLRSMTTHGGGTQLPYVPGLDGLRALAVIAVLLYHADVVWMRGGFLGVEIFFVISGFLITSLLLAEYRTTGGINLLKFWFRRARRLLPAVFFMIAVTITFAVIFLPDEVAGLRSDALAAFGYVTNWYLIFANESYFEAVGRPSLLKHLWSLAVEEQFYLFWPIVLGVGLLLFRRGGIFVMAVVGAIVSAVLMYVLYDPNLDPSRIYYGTDTRAAGLMIGAALAFVWLPGRGFVRPNRHGSRGLTGRGGKLKRRLGWLSPLALDVVGIAALGALVWFCLNVGEFDPFLYRGGFVLVALATAALIAAVVHPHTHLGVLGVAPMRWIGLRSYGIYLWHWPVFMITRPDLDVSINGWELLALRLIATVALADLSYRYIEMPIRRGSLGKAFRELREARGTRRKRLGFQWGAATAFCAAFCVVLGTNMVSAKAPETPDYLQNEAIQADVNLSKVQDSDTVEPEAVPSKEEKAKAEDPEPETPRPENAEAGNRDAKKPDDTEASSSDAKQNDEEKEGSGTAQAEVEPAPDGLATGIGDSVMLGASRQLEHRIPDFTITDSSVGMQVADAIAIIQSRKDAGQLGDTVVLQIGTNGTFTEDEFDEIMTILEDTPRVVFVNLEVPRSWEASNNQVITEGVERYDNATLVDWHSVGEQHPEYFWDDGIHTRPKGSKVYADLIAEHLGR